MKRAVVLGASGFLGSHLVDRLLLDGWQVVGVDNLSTGSLENLVQVRTNSAFQLIEADICQGIPVTGLVDVVFNLASPASPIKYLEDPIGTLHAGSIGTEAAIELTLRSDARLVMASTSEIYGDPLVTPQPESYWGNVNSIGSRSCYDEAKRYSEALISAYRRKEGLNAAIVRIFNTYGPRLDPFDGRVVSTFIRQALQNEPLSIFGDGTQTRSFCYVSDLIDGLIHSALGDYCSPVNFGNPEEFTIKELANTVIALCSSDSAIVHHDLPEDDPKQRNPDISVARNLYKWSPKVRLMDGLPLTINWCMNKHQPLLQSPEP
jgi:dTDP-glucose 4,6-dehydratase